MAGKSDGGQVEDGDYYDDIDYAKLFGTYDAVSEEEIEVQQVDDGLIGNLPREIYCHIVETLKDHCAEGSLLELWDYSQERIEGLSREQVGRQIIFLYIQYSRGVKDFVKSSLPLPDN